MLNIPDSIKALFKQDGVYKNFRVHFPNGEMADLTNGNVVQESVKFSESICSQDVFKFGLTEASVIEFETVGVANMYGMTIECSCEIDCFSLSAADKAAIAAGTWDGTWDGVNAVFSVPYGTFRVESCPRDHQAMAHRKVTAYTDEIIKDEDAFVGQFPTARLLFYPDEYFYSKTLNTSDMDEESANEVSPSSGCDISRWTGFTSNDTYLFFDGVLAERRTVYTYSSGFLHPELFEHRKVYLRIGDYNRTEFDDAAQSMFDAAIASMPNVSPIYYYSGVTNYAISKNKNTAAASGTGMFLPCFIVSVYYTRLNGSYYENIWQVSYPVFVDAGATYVVNTKDLSNYKFQAALPGTGWQMYKIEIDTSIPWGWRRSARWATELAGTPGRTYYNVTNWPISGLFPEDEDVIYRNADQQPSVVYVDEVIDDSTGVAVLIESTQSFKKNPFGSYYTYSNSVSVRELINSYFEITAKFLTASRLGGQRVISLSNSCSVPVIPGEYSKMWFDEYDVESIGTIRYAYTDEAGEQQVVDYQFGDGASIYDMTDNAVLKLMDGADPSVIEPILDASFIPYVGAVNFVPIDLQMKGLPYIEAGDALQVIAQDATECYSFALRHEISGIQALEAQIDSQSGLIIESGEATT